MLFGFLVFLFTIVCVLLTLLILLQKSKSSLGIGYTGGQAQNLFGGSGGQELFQKITWGLGAIFMAGSLMLAIMKKPAESEFLRSVASHQASQVKVPERPAEDKKEEAAENLNQ